MKNYGILSMCFAGQSSFNAKQTSSSSEQING